MTWNSHLKTTQSQKINPIQIIKKPTQIKINPSHPNQINPKIKLF